MTIEYGINKILWEQETRPVGFRGRTLPALRLRPGPEKGLISIISSLGSPLDFDEDQFFAMAQAGAAYFGKKLEITNSPTPCPNCGATVFGYFRDSEFSRVQKFCDTCGLTGPYGVTENGADEAWELFFHRAKLSLSSSYPDAATEEPERS